jgi:hypothetical protein
MISVVCVYNSEEILKNVLLKSLDTQTIKFELITLDNRDNRYSSAAEALNYGGGKAKGEYIMFVHQDMWLGSNSWLDEVEKCLESIPDLGIAGVAGMIEKGRNWEEWIRRSLDACDEAWWGKSGRIKEPEEVQTLDECLLLVPRAVFNRLKFDEKTFDGWHLYGADYCLCVRELGLKAWVIPAFSSHSSPARNMKSLLKYQRRLYAKHKTRDRHIHTYLGEISYLELRLNLLRQLFRPFYFRFFPDLTMTVRRALSGCSTVLDLGCGYNSLIAHSSIPFSVGVELFEPYLQESKRRDIHTQYIKADVCKLEFKPRSFHAVIAIGILEHLTKEEGYELIRRMEEWASKKIVITTPNGYLRQDTLACANNPLQEHKSGWTTAEFKKLGFSVFGINGWRGLRGHKALIKYRPAFLWMRISDLTQKITYHYPKLAFQLLAIKRIEQANRR